MVSDDKAKEYEEQQGAAGDPGDEAAPGVRVSEGGGAAEEVPDESPEALKELLDQVRNQAEENWNQFLRAKAELDNLQRRSRQEVEKARKSGMEKLLLELLPVKDSLELGVAAAAEADDGAASKFREGAELTLKKFDEVFEKFGVEALDPAGKKFDPSVHEAISAQPTSEQPANTVMTVIQKGYRLEERLLRPAMVVVAQAPAEPGGDGE